MLNGISYQLCPNNTFPNTDTWWVFMPYGSWSTPLKVPNPPPLVRSFINTLGTFTVGDLGKDEKFFIDIALLDAIDREFANAVAPALISLINDVAKKNHVVIRYLQGSIAAKKDLPSPYEQNGGLITQLSQAIADNSIPHANNVDIYFGSYSPSITTNTTLGLEPQSSVSFESAFRSTLLQFIKKIWGAIVKEVREFDPKLAKIFENVESHVYAWCMRHIKDIEIPVLSWNHAKILAVNGQRLLTGTNFWDIYTEGNEWLFDLSMQIQGDSACGAHNFANYMWAYLNNIPSWDKTSVSLYVNLADIRTTTQPFVTPKGKIPMFSAHPTNVGSVTALSIGNIGNLGEFPYPALVINALRDLLTNMAIAIGEAHSTPPYTNFGVIVANLLADDAPVFANALSSIGISPAAWGSRALRNLAISKSSTVVRIAQEMIGNPLLTANTANTTYMKDVDIFNKETGSNWNGYIWPIDMLMAMAQSIASMSQTSSPVGVQLVTSCAEDNEGYYDPISTSEIVQKLTGIMNGMRAIKILKFNGDASDLVGRLFTRKRIDPNIKKKPHGSHFKLVVADDAVLYLGSDNAYPAYCQEHGVWIDDKPSITAFVNHYWTSLWDFTLAE